ncbi:terminus macrodomain insulation protein YfbV [Thalassotalea aquiviva]|uniref:terminus macrodomain insulation protein YfbV n=1 Tax=Thalassotalea aquiviva TaxID=3242415 RepID=UPI00352AE8FB
MNRKIYCFLKDGAKYIRLWPNTPELANYFAEYNAVVGSRFVLKYCPPLALLAIILPIMFLGPDFLSQALVYGIFIASLPVQALFLMAKKSKEHLPLALASWYRQGVEKLNQHQQQNKLTLVQKPTFMDLAKLLDYSYSHQAEDL